jgi:hypothetical protein
MIPQITSSLKTLRNARESLVRAIPAIWWYWILLSGLAALGFSARPGSAAESEPAPVADPIADYLAMQVPDRKANAGQLWILKVVAVDVDGDGKPEVFVGTWYRKSGPNTWLWTGYTPVRGGYRRITPANADVLIDFNQIYVGPIPELHRQGMVQGYSLELDNQQRDQSNLLSDITYYYLEAENLVEHGTGPLDRDDPEQRKRYEFFFGAGRQIRETPRIESFTVAELVHRGYHVPHW